MRQTAARIGWICAGLALAATAAAQSPQTSHPLDTARIEELTGVKGKFDEKEQVFKITSPRTDVNISVDGWTMPPFMGLTSWAAFKPGTQLSAMVMGDLVLMQDEVNPVMSALLDNGLAVTALHNHFFYDEPKVYFMHIAGEGDVEKLAMGVRRALEKVKAIRAASPEPSRRFAGEAITATSAISAEPLERILGVKGQSNEGMVKIVIGRTTQMSCGCEAGKEMGVNTWAAFAGSDERAIVDGDVAVLESELQGVLKSLRSSGINIVAIHNHMTGDTPRMLFLHYWGLGSARDLATAVMAALNETQSGPGRNAADGEP